MRVVFWGTYDLGKPRVRILLKGLMENHVDVLECHSEVWSNVEDKSQITGWKKKIKFIVKWIFSYPSLIVRYIRLPKHDVVFIGYLGQLDVLFLWPFARLRGVPIVWDAFLSLYDTVVEDRKLISAKNPLAYLLYFWEYLACRAANLILLDTEAHARYFRDQFRIPPAKTAAIFVGVEPEKFSRLETTAEKKSGKNPEKEITVLFYGQFIPLHGIDTIVKAAQLMNNEPVKWILIGKGQEEVRIKEMLNSDPKANLEWINWVDYSQLIQWIAKADICLGIFGSSSKSARVIPNKVFQILNSGKPLITRDSPAIRELLNPNMPGIFLIDAANPNELVDTVRKFSSHQTMDNFRLHEEVRSKFNPRILAKSLIKIIEDNRSAYFK